MYRELNREPIPAENSSRAVSMWDYLLVRARVLERHDH
nr:MAG TPA: hypothetical protein [Caudoviricetes sp.]